VARYILNSPVLTDYGVYQYTQLTLDQARAWVRRGPFESAVGHEPTARFLSRLLGVTVLARRVAIKMQPGDEALVFRVLGRLPEGRVLSETELPLVQYEFGLLRRFS
jgi:hypothetical protein